MTTETKPAIELPDLLRQLQQLGVTASTPWGAGASPPTPASVAVPIKLQTPTGSIRVYLQFAGEHATPERLPALLEQLASQGVPLDVWQPKSSGGWNGGGNGYRGGYGRRW